MKIWIISQFTDDISTNTSNRYAYIYNILKKQGYEVKFVTSDFNHVTKKKKIVENQDLIKIKEPGYKSNVSLWRIYSHMIYAKNAYLFIKGKVNKTDIVLVALPSNLLGYLLGNLKRKINFKLIVDVHDVWPDSLVVLLPKIIKIFGYPFWKVWKKLRVSTVKNSDYLIAESKEYTDMHVKYLAEGVESNSILLGADISKVRDIPRKIIKEDSYKIVFAGTLGVNYDIDTSLKMIEKYNKELNENKIEIYFFGNGEKEVAIKNILNKYPNIVKHIERVTYYDYISILKGFDAGLNSFQKNSSVRYSYKSVDYLVAGLPVLNNLQGEFATDIENYRIGENYTAGDIDSLYLNLIKLINNIKEDRSYKANVEDYVSLKLDRQNIYTPLLNFISRNNE